MSTVHDLDQEIHELELRVLELKKKRNLLIWICRFPPEVLAGVFGYLQRPYDSADWDPSTWMLYQNTWLKVMLVCQYFREVALQMPVLWDIIDYKGHSQAWTDMCYQRSGIMPLTLHDDTGIIPASHWSQCATALLEGRAVYEEPLDWPAPALRKLSLKAGTRHYVMTDLFLAGSASNLVVMDVEGVIFDRAPVMPALRHLHIRSGVVPELSHLHQLLSGCVNLQSLSIQHLNIMAQRNRPAVTQPSTILRVEKSVQLHQLLYLEIIDQAPLVSALLRLLPSPAKALHVEVEDSILGADRIHMGLITANHTILYEQCMSFLGIGDFLPNGVARISLAPPGFQMPYPLLRLDYGTPFNIKDVWTAEGVLFHLRIGSCQTHPAHELLSSVETLRLVQDLYEPDPVIERYFTEASIGNMARLEHLVLEGFSDSSHMFPAQEWVMVRAQRGEMLKRITFVGASDEILEMVERENGESWLVGEVSYSDY